MVWAYGMVFFLIGMMLLYACGLHFVFKDDEGHAEAMKIAFWVLLLLIAAARLIYPIGTENDPKQSIASAGVQWLVSTVLIAGALVYSANGYITLFSAITGETLIVHATVCCQREPAILDGGCDYYGTIEFLGQKHEECFDDLADSDAEFDVGQRDVQLKIRLSSIGYNVLELRFTT